MPAWRRAVRPDLKSGGYREFHLFGQVLSIVRSDYVEKPDDSKLIEGAINGMLAALDPHSSYMNAKQFREMQVETRGEFGGLGLEVTMEKGLIKVIAPIEDSPAAKAGLQSGDQIIALDKEHLQGLTLQEAVEKMRGPVNAPITLTIVRKGLDDPFDVKMIRDVIRIKPVKYNAEGDVGYIHITSFNEQTTADLQEAVEHLKKEIGPKLTGYIVDLRNNPGGLLDQAISVSDDFLNQGAIVITKGRNPEDVQRADAGQATSPMVRSLWSWSMAARPRPRRSWRARSRITSGPPSSARDPSARAPCRLSFHSVRSVRSD